MNGLKNLLPKNSLSDENINTLMKKSEEYKKSLMAFISHMEHIAKVYDDYYTVSERNLCEIEAQFHKLKENLPKPYKDIVELFKKLNCYLQKFIAKQECNNKDFSQMNQIFMTDYIKILKDFQQKAKQYCLSQSYLMEICKRYFKDHKVMVANKQSYKNSFVDVKLIYNNNEKLKRYNQCLLRFNNLAKEFDTINLKVDDLNFLKGELAKIYDFLEKQLRNYIMSIANKFIAELNKLFKNLTRYFEQCLSFLQSQTVFNEIYKDKIIFETTDNLKYSNAFLTCQVRKDQIRFIPCYFVYSKHLTEDGIVKFNKMLISYLLEITQQIQRKKAVNKLFIAFFTKSLKIMEKYYVDKFKETVNSFEKIRKKIGEVCGQKWNQFYQIISKVFSNFMEVNCRLMNRVNQKIKGLDNSIQTESFILQYLVKDLKVYIEKVTNKKFYKRCQNENIENVQNDVLTRMQIAERCQFVTNLVQNNIEKLKKATETINFNIKSCISDIKISFSEHFSYCQQMNEDNFESEQYSIDYKVYEKELHSCVEKQVTFLHSLPLAITKQERNVSFDGEFNKIEQFTKLKKPKELQDLKNNEELDEAVKTQYQEPITESNRQTVKQPIRQSVRSSIKTDPSEVIGHSRNQTFLSKKTGKNALYILSRISPEQNEIYLKSSSCGLADNIILSGKMYITTHRIIFHSNFNRNNVFFGETLIRIPKNDIKKIEKKVNAIFFDNSILITTVNGQVFFTSFFHRDEVYDLLIKTFEINIEEQLFIEEEDKEDDEVEEPALLTESPDDITLDQVKEREDKINEMLASFDFTQIFQDQYTSNGFNCLSFLKIFQLDSQIQVQRSKYPSFLHFFKQLNEHKQIQIQQWNPSPLQFLNPLNIKKSTPLVFKRKLQAEIPIPSSPLPFMPKFTITSEDVSLFIVSKDKFILENVVKSRGAPYTKSFDIRYKRVYESSAQNVVKLKVSLFLNFYEYVLVRSTIQSKTIESSKETYEKMSQCIKSHLKIIGKKTKVKNENHSQIINQDLVLLKQENDELSQQNQELKRQNKILKNELSILKSGETQKKMLLVLLLVWCVFQFLYILRQ